MPSAMRADVVDNQPAQGWKADDIEAKLALNVDIDSLTGSLSPRSGPLPQPHTSATAVLVYELNASDFDRSSNLFGCVFAATQFAIH